MLNNAVVVVNSVLCGYLSVLRSVFHIALWQLNLDTGGFLLTEVKRADPQFFFA